MLKANKKNICNAIFFLFIVGITFYLLLRKQELPIILDSIRKANIFYVLVSFCAVVIFVCCESVIICYMMNKLNSKMKLKKCVKYSFIGFFFSCITPSATGGQPAQLYYMKKDKADLGIATLVLVVVTVAYKSVLIIFGMILLTARKEFVTDYLGKNIYFLYFGVMINIFVVFWLVLIIFRTSSIRKLTRKLICKLASMKLIKHQETMLNKADHAFEQYNNSADFLKKNINVAIVVFLISFIQRFIMFLVTYFIYRAFGLSKYSLFDIVSLQAVISIAVDMLPLPGGVGASENLFIIIFKKIFGSNLIMPSMLLSRGISYYGLLLISAAVTVIVQIKSSFHKDVAE